MLSAHNKKHSLRFQIPLDGLNSFGFDRLVWTVVFTAGKKELKLSFQIRQDGLKSSGFDGLVWTVVLTAEIIKAGFSNFSGIA